jgi:steroid delta-isomerase
MVIEPIDVMVFDGHGKITAMKAYWSQADVTQV